MGSRALTATYNPSGGYLTSTSPTLTQTVAKRTVTGAFTASNKAYDGNANATIATRALSGGIVPGDDVSLSGGTATFDSKNIGANKLVTGSGFTLAGANAGNYQLGSSSLTTRADITAHGVTVGFTAASKEYDATRAATITSRTLSGVVPGDTVTVSNGNATFADKNAGSAKTVEATGFTLGGADAANYSITVVNSAKADITAKPVTGSFTATDKVYDGTDAASVTDRKLVGVIDGDVVSLSGGSSTFDTKNVGQNKTVTLTGASLAGADGGNYTLRSVGSALASITAKGVTVVFTADDKVYDGTASATILSRELRGVATGDTLTVTGGSAVFANANAGAGKTVTGSGFTLGGADAVNYSVTVDSTTASITAKSLKGSFAAASKVYDGNAAATVNGRSLTGVIDGDLVSLSGGSATFDNKNAGQAKTVTLTGAELAGAGQGNYTLASVATTTADITAKSVTGSFATKTKVYDGDASATATDRALTGAVAGDEVSLAGGSATFDNKNVGQAKTVTLTGAELTGADKGNYTLSSVGTRTADITAQSITGSFTTTDKVYDGDVSATATDRALSGAVAGDEVSLTGGSATFDNKNVGQAKTVTLTGAELTGADKGNYTLSSVETKKADITALSITGSFTAADKPYDGNATAQILTRSLAGVLGADEVRLSGDSASFSNRSVGTDKTVTGTGFALVGDGATNYVLSSSDAHHHGQHHPPGGHRGTSRPATRPTTGPTTPLSPAAR